MVLVVLGVLITLLLPAIRNTWQRGAEGLCAANLERIGGAMPPRQHPHWRIAIAGQGGLHDRKPDLDPPQTKLSQRFRHLSKMVIPRSDRVLCQTSVSTSPVPRRFAGNLNMFLLPNIFAPSLPIPIILHDVGRGICNRLTVAGVRLKVTVP